MLVFATSDKGGTGRSVTSCNVAYRSALQGKNVCYLDFDFGSPTAGAIFEIATTEIGTDRGLHSCLLDRTSEPERIDIWSDARRTTTRIRPPHAGNLVLYPADRGGGEFPMGPSVLERCAKLFARLDLEFDICIIDLSAGRSHAVDAVLEVTARRELKNIERRWMVYHRWTRQHIVAAADLVYGEHGLLKTGIEHGHDEGLLRDSIRFVRTAVQDLDSPDLAPIRDTQVAWLRVYDENLRELAARNRLGVSSVLGSTPLDPVLQWREQIITDDDVSATKIANAATRDAFATLAQRLTEDTAWQSL
jgi:hypothetical protein